VVGAPIQGIPSLPGESLACQESISRGRYCTRWKAPPFHGAYPIRTWTCKFAKQDIVEYGQNCQDQSGLIPSSLMIGPHLSISDVSKVASSVGVEFTGDAAISPSRCLTGG